MKTRVLILLGTLLFSTVGFANLKGEYEQQQRIKAAGGDVSAIPGCRFPQMCVDAIVSLNLDIRTVKEAFITRIENPCPAAGNFVNAVYLKLDNGEIVTKNEIFECN